jgi:hypothetical protein
MSTAADYSGDQFASIKIYSLSSGQAVALHLRAINNYWTNGVIEVGYTQGSGVAIYTFDGSNLVQRGSTIAASFGSGDVFKAVSSASGMVTVYKNGASVGSVSVTGWSGYNRAGQVGLWTNASGALLDDFDGGASAGGPSNTPTPTTVPTSTPTPTSASGCSVLDCFTTGLSGNWTGDTGSFSINSNQLVAANDKALFWNASYSGDQFASIKIYSLSNGQAVALHLRAINNYWTNGVIEVGYTQGSGVSHLHLRWQQLGAARQHDCGQLWQRRCVQGRLIGQRHGDGLQEWREHRQRQRDGLERLQPQRPSGLVDKCVGCVAG